MEDGRIPKDLLYGELATGKRPTGRPQLSFNDVCKRDLQALGINTDSWEVTATDRDAWRHTVKVGLSQYEETQRLNAEEKRLYKRTACLASRPTTPFTCVIETATPELVFTAKTDAAKWVQIYGLLRPTDANELKDEEVKINT